MGDYFEVDSLAVDRHKRRLAERTLALACDDLGIGDSYRPTLRWFSEEDDRDREYVARWGSHFSDRLTIDHPGVLEGRTTFGDNVIVWIRASAPLASLPVTVAHEAAHVALRRLRGPAGSPSEQAHQEAAADAYGQRYSLEDHL